MNSFEAIAAAIANLSKRVHELEIKDPQWPPASFASAGPSALVLTGSPQDVPGCTLTLSGNRYLVIAVFTCTNTSPDTSMIGYLVVGGTPESRTATMSLAASPAQAVQVWSVSPAASDTVVKLQAAKTGGGNSVVATGSTTITAVEIA